MPPLTYPDKLTYYAFSREIHPFFAKALNKTPVDPTPMIEKAKFIESLAKDIDVLTDEDRQAIWDRQYELIEDLEDQLEASSLCTRSIILSFDGSDCLGNERPYDSEVISEPFFRGIQIYAPEMSEEMFCAVFQNGQIFEQRDAYREMAELPFFKHRMNDFEQIESIFDFLRMNGRPSDWILVGILRSYYLFRE
jgi:hypothetical protein